MVRGIESFRSWFNGFEDRYVIIGGTACDLLMSDAGLDFRATKDLDIVLIIESVDSEFAARFWQFVKTAGYKHINKSTGKSQFYRFSSPVSPEYPAMIELFSRKPDAVLIPEDAVLTPLPADDDVSSLSAILLNEDYYEFLRHGTTEIDGMTILDAIHLIPFKAKAWIDLSERRAMGQQIDSRNIKKHKNDVFRLTELLPDNAAAPKYMPESIQTDMLRFTERISGEDIDLTQLGMSGKNKNDILEKLRSVYNSD